MQAILASKVIENLDQLVVSDENIDFDSRCRASPRATRRQAAWQFLC